MTADREPAVGLESVIAAGQHGEVDTAAVVNALLASILIVPSGAEIDSGRGEFQPVLFPRDDGQYVAVFTAMDRIGEFSQITPFSAAMSGADVVKALTPGSGLVINPASPLGFELDPQTLDSIRAYLVSRP